MRWVQRLRTCSSSQSRPTGHLDLGGRWFTRPLPLQGSRSRMASEGSSQLTETSQGATALKPAQTPSPDRPLHVSGGLLDEICNASALSHHPADELAMIWNTYHAHRPYSVHGTLTAASWLRLWSRAQRYPLTLLPLHRPPLDPGSPLPNPSSTPDPSPSDVAATDFFLSQAHGSCFWLIPLGRFQQHGPLAEPALTLQFYTDFLDTPHQLVLIRGTIAGSDRVHTEISEDSCSPPPSPEAAAGATGALTVRNAQHLAAVLQLAYLLPPYYALTQAMHDHPASFRYEDLLALDLADHLPGHSGGDLSPSPTPSPA